MSRRRAARSGATSSSTATPFRTAAASTRSRWSAISRPASPCSGRTISASTAPPPTAARSSTARLATASSSVGSTFPSRFRLIHQPLRLHQIGNEVLERLVAGLVPALAQDRRGMDGRKDAHTLCRMQHLAADGTEGHRLSHQPAQRRDAERDRQGWMHELELLAKPPAADVDFRVGRPLVQTALAAPLELEMLHRIGDIERLPREPRLFQRAVENTAGRPDEGLAHQILL